MPPRPQVVISEPSLTVEPGRRVGTRVRIRNTGRQVAHYRVSVVDGCAPAAWATVANPEVKLNPGADTEVLVQFEPPHDTRTRAGTFPYGVRIEPGPDDGQLPMVGEGDLTVGAITAIEVHLRPRRSAGRFNGKHRVVLDNTGTEDLQVRLRAFDDDEKLSAAVVPQTVTVPAGGTGEALLRVRARSPLVVGKRQSHPFHVAYRRRAGSSRSTGGPTDGGEVEAVVDGSYEQKPIVAKWMVVAGALLTALAAFLIWRAIQPPEPEPGPPPAAPVAVTAEQLPGGMVLLSWQTEANVATVRLRGIDCATSADPLPRVVNSDLPEVDVADTSRGSQRVGPFDLEVPLCFQARSVTADGAVSVWSREGGTITLGREILPAPTGLAAVPGDQPGTAMVSWDPVQVDGDVRYDLLVDGRSVDPNGIAATQQQLSDLEPGDRVIEVQTLVDGRRSPKTEAQVVTVAAPSEEGGGGGDSTGDGGGGSPPTSEAGTALPLPEGIFVVILPEGGSTPPQVSFALDVARRGDPAIEGDEAFPEARAVVVDADIALPGIPVEAGQTVLVADRLDSQDEAQRRCTTYVEVVERLLQEGRAGAGSGLSATCVPHPPLAD